ncbi:hypothetical protein K504DRAFT_462720 [Pleomassaria siparia CBS 279.74]|uniref:BTB domain-containing protein n=1 Tax=Pleomassaria siparia CBS 279.74 TaxID=1314801 RepID=A0A6G1JUF0_9PLEO|nr:hypothetical protein K504DRAFT_462720 [Pleomassaria siparia CBS 279.74]
MAPFAPHSENIDPWLTSPSMIGLQCGIDGNTTTLYVPEGLLRQYSSYCDSLLRHADTVDGNFTKVIRLPHEAHIVQLYVQSLYTDHVLPRTAWFPDVNDGGTDAALAMAHLLVLAEFLQDIQTKKTILTAMLQDMCPDLCGKRKIPSDLVVSILFEGTEVGSSIRKFFVDAVARFGTVDWFEDTERDGSPPKQFLLQLAREMVRVRDDACMEPMVAAEYVAF